MTHAEIKQLLARGKTLQFRFDANMKTEINRATMDAVMREVRKGLAAKKKLTVVVVSK